MPNETCTCCGTVESQRTGTNSETEPQTEGDSGTGAAPEGRASSSADRWLGDSSVTEATLPDDVRSAMERFFGDASIDSLEDWTSELRRRTGGALEVADLCHADGETDHWGELDGERYYFRCFYDTVALAELTSEAVEIHTVSPEGAAIEARTTGDGELATTPTTAVVSFGTAVDESRPPTTAPTLEDAYEAICPTVRAFPTRRAYERWATKTPVATVGMPLSTATAVAIELVE
ncbi:organomercurial lyase [Natrinema caseinilyticum]|uniref:organomercurial lyase n=1 Tax=Natrinema caseinilyticum TaxID=2961570 RepID=UPI0020C46435|nr:organomercurial lyase [Natrinema caseinilyticum]